jgi:hypothetical protein
MMAAEEALTSMAIEINGMRVPIEKTDAATSEAQR